MKRMISLMLSAAMVLVMATGCANPGTPSSGDDKSTTSASTSNAPSDPNAAEGWPDKTINIYMTHGAGGDTDYMGRQLATALESELGVSVVVTNVTGANGATCMQQYKDGDRRLHLYCH